MPDFPTQTMPGYRGVVRAAQTSIGVGLALAWPFFKEDFWVTLKPPGTVYVIHHTCISLPLAYHSKALPTLKEKEATTVLPSVLLGFVPAWKETVGEKPWPWTSEGECWWCAVVGSSFFSSSSVRLASSSRLEPLNRPSTQSTNTSQRQKEMNLEKIRGAEKCVEFT